MIQVPLMLGLLQMIFNVLSRFQLGRLARGGVIQERLSQLHFIALFTTGYLGTGILIWSRPSDTLLPTLSLIWLFGAAFVVLVKQLVEPVMGALEG